MHIYRPQDHPLFEFIFRIGLLTPSFFSQIFAAMFTFKMASAAGKNCKVPTGLHCMTFKAQLKLSNHHHMANGSVILDGK